MSEPAANVRKFPFLEFSPISVGSGTIAKSQAFRGSQAFGHGSLGFPDLPLSAQWLRSRAAPTLKGIAERWLAGHRFRSRVDEQRQLISRP